MKYKKGFSLLVGTIFIGGLLIIAGGIYYLVNINDNSQPITQDNISTTTLSKNDSVNPDSSTGLDCKDYVSMSDIVSILGVSNFTSEYTKQAETIGEEPAMGCYVKWKLPNDDLRSVVSLSVIKTDAGNNVNAYMCTHAGELGLAEPSPINGAKPTFKIVGGLGDEGNACLEIIPSMISPAPPGYILNFTSKGFKIGLGINMPGMDKQIVQFAKLVESRLK